MAKTLEKLEKQWKTSLEDFEYVGELSLNFQDFEKYILLLKERYILTHPWNRQTFAYKTTLSVLAVNCTYFDYDDQGFWAHFLERLGLQDCINHQRDIGRIIEDYLYENQFVTKRRSGAFRYVGALLEQCGITRRYLPKFSVFLLDGSRKYDWDGLATITFESYLRLIPDQGISGYLKKFLEDRIGWEFVRSVARSINQHRQGILSLEELKNIKGFRPSFWEELLGFLEKMPPDRKPSPTRKIPLPVLFFQPELNRIALVFDELNVRLGNYRLGDDPLSQSYVILEHPDSFQESYLVGRKTKDQTWILSSVKGWDPQSQAVSFALFDGDKKTLIDTDIPINEGNYFLVISSQGYAGLPDESQSLLKNITIVDYGWLSLPHGIYHSWLIAVESDTDLSFLGLDVSTIQKQYISWANKESAFAGAVDLHDVFAGGTPHLLVQQPEKFAANMLALFFDTGAGPQRIEVSTDTSEIKIPHSVPAKGEVWVEPIGRYREFSGDNSLNRLSFCCLPQCSVEWPQNLLSPNEKTSVLFSTNDEKTSVTLEDCISQDIDKRIWEVPPGITTIDGRITADHVSVHLSWLLHRASFTDSKGYRIDDTTVEELLNQDEVIATGFPGETAKIYGIIEGNEKPFATLGKFGQSGNLAFKTDALRDVLRNNLFAVARLAIGHRSKVIPTTTRLLNDKEIFKRLISTEDDFSWISEFEEQTKNALSLLRGAIRKELRSIPFLTYAQVPVALWEWAVIILLCAKHFDDVKLSEFSEEEYSHLNISEQLELFEWYSKAQNYINSQNANEFGTVESLLEEFDAIKWQPPLDRWNAKVTEVLKKLKSEIDLTELLIGWKEEVMQEGYFTSYRSGVANLNYGNTLTIAWKEYVKGNTKGAYIKASRVFESSRSPVKDLALLLINLTLIEAENYKFIELYTDGTQYHKKLWPHIETTILYTKINIDEINKDEIVPVSNHENGVELDLLPLKDKDFEVLDRRFI